MESEGDEPWSGLGLRVWRHNNDWVNHIKLNLFSCYNLWAGNEIARAFGGWVVEIVTWAKGHPVCLEKEVGRYYPCIALQGANPEVGNWGSPLIWNRKVVRETERTKGAANVMKPARGSKERRGWRSNLQKGREWMTVTPVAYCWPRTVHPAAWERPSEGASVSDQPSRARSLNLLGMPVHPRLQSTLRFEQTWNW